MLVLSPLSLPFVLRDEVVLLDIDEKYFYENNCLSGCLFEMKMTVKDQTIYKRCEITTCRNSHSRRSDSENIHPSLTSHGDPSMTCPGYTQNPLRP